MELADGQGDWQCKMHSFPGEADFWTLCNPEDVAQCEACKRRGRKVICKSCDVPLRRSCVRVINGHAGGGIAASLCNDNYWGHTSEALYELDARWIEVAVASPCWTTMLVFYVEGDKGHLLGEKFTQQSWRTRVRGSACSFHMPWEDIIRDLQRHVDDETFADMPRSAESLKYMLRVHL